MEEIEKIKENKFKIEKIKSDMVVLDEIESKLEHKTKELEMSIMDVKQEERIEEEDGEDSYE